MGIKEMSSFGDNKSDNIDEINLDLTYVKKQIESMPKNVDKGQQNKHIEGTNEFKIKTESFRQKGQYGVSRISGIEFAQYLIDKYSGTGTPEIFNGEWIRSEKIKTNEVIGIVVNNITGVEKETTNFKIHYRNSGAHVVPDYPNRGDK